MKTTGGKTKARRQPRRSVSIHQMPKGFRVQVRYASSLKQGLEEFFKERLQPQGWGKVKIVGNVLTVSKGDELCDYRALEEYQKP